MGLQISEDGVENILGSSGEGGVSGDDGTLQCLDAVEHLRVGLLLVPVQLLLGVSLVLRVVGRSVEIIESSSESSTITFLNSVLQVTNSSEGLNGSVVVSNSPILDEEASSLGLKDCSADCI